MKTHLPDVYEIDVNSSESLYNYTNCMHELDKSDQLNKYYSVSHYSHK
jgi:hypothetical protein